MRVTSFLGLAGVLVVLSASSVACDDGTGGGGGGTGELGLGNFYEAYDKARCDYFVRCGFLSDKAKCATAFGPDRDASQGVASAVFGTLGFDGTKAKACIDSFGIAVCDTQPYYGLSESIETACDAVFTDKGADDAPCFSGIECQSAFCEVQNCNDACCEGKCKANPLIPTDGDCTGGKLCVEGDYCDQDMNTCKPRKGANEACPQPGSCVAGYVCDDQGGKCFKSAPSGASCNPTLMTSPCEQSAAEYCDPDAKVCKPWPKIGEPCVASGPNMGGCGVDGYCAMGTCTARPGEGEMCGPGNVCVGTVQCDDMSMMCVREPATTCIH